MDNPVSARVLAFVAVLCSGCSLIVDGVESGTGLDADIDGRPSGQDGSTVEEFDSAPGSQVDADQSTMHTLTLRVEGAFAGQVAFTNTIYDGQICDSTSTPCEFSLAENEMVGLLASGQAFEREYIVTGACSYDESWLTLDVVMLGECTVIAVYTLN